MAVAEVNLVFYGAGLMRNFALTQRELLSVTISTMFQRRHCFLHAALFGGRRR